MSNSTSAEPRPCEKIRCTSKVLDALEIATGAGGHKKVVLDVRPTSWANGARFRASTHQPVAGELHVVVLRTAGQAFGMNTLYRKHADTCGGGSGVKARSKEAA